MFAASINRPDGPTYQLRVWHSNAQWLNAGTFYSPLVAPLPSPTSTIHILFWMSSHATSMSATMSPLPFPHSCNPATQLAYSSSALWGISSNVVHSSSHSSRYRQRYGMSSSLELLRVIIQKLTCVQDWSLYNEQLHRLPCHLLPMRCHDCHPSDNASVGG